MPSETLHAEPLTLGHGPRVLDIFLEPTCPFCVKTFGKLEALMAAAGEDRLTVRLRLHAQPWHMYSGVIIRAILAASTLADGKPLAMKVIAAVGDHRAEFEFEQHARGPNMDATPNDILARIEAYSGVALKAAFDQPGLEAEIKWHAKYSRQNGIHVSPTFMIDGLIAPNMSSGDTIEEWIAALDLA